MNQSILIAEDDDLAYIILERALRNHGYEVFRAQTGATAIEMIESGNFPVMLLDLRLPDVSGLQVLESTRRQKTPPVVIIQTSDSDIQSVVKHMRTGAFDYITKPVNTEELLFKITRAFEIFHIRRIQAERGDTGSSGLSDSFRELQERNLHNLHRYNKSLFESLQTNFNQGAGIGMLISLISLLAMQSKKDGDHYLVPSETMELVFQNASIAEKTLGRINELHFLQTRDLELSAFNGEDFYNLINDVVESAQSIAAIKEQTLGLQMDQKSFEREYTLVNRSLFTQALQEVLTNAFKFSEEKSIVHINITKLGESLHLAILNSPLSDRIREKGFEDDMDQVIFEPFFRETRMVDERYDTLDYGLGLTYARTVVERHNGKLTAATVLDEKLSPGRMVSLDIELPLFQEEDDGSEGGDLKF